MKNLLLFLALPSRTKEEAVNIVYNLSLNFQKLVKIKK
tara:strand:+ start:320 stop:433 length:114 start_codon:yes stop_codon:yes gene_type:complete